MNAASHLTAERIESATRLPMALSFEPISLVVSSMSARSESARADCAPESSAMAPIRPARAADRRPRGFIMWLLFFPRGLRPGGAALCIGGSSLLAAGSAGGSHGEPLVRTLVTVVIHAHRRAKFRQVGYSGVADCFHFK